jgi:shikimate dehydrogenase
MQDASISNEAPVASLLNGETRVYAIIGHPIAQVKSPANVTASLRAKSLNAVLVPYHVAPEDFDTVVSSLTAVKNFDGLVITIPHKFAAFRHCARLTERAAFLGAVNVMRRNLPSGWYGDMCDGIGFVGAIEAKGGTLGGKSALLVGAGGAGSAIGYSLLERGVAELAIHDIDATRRDELIENLARKFGDRVRPGSHCLSGRQVFANATPLGLGSPDVTHRPRSTQSRHDRRRRDHDVWGHGIDSCSQAGWLSHNDRS